VRQINIDNWRIGEARAQSGRPASGLGALAALCAPADSASGNAMIINSSTNSTRLI